MSEFPVITEILEHIFQFLDGMSLCYCEQVCHRWKNVIGEMGNVWPQLCDMEIPEDAFYELVNDIDPTWTPGSPDDALDYYGLYHTWFLWRTKLKSEEGVVRSTKGVKLDTNVIVCMAVSGDIIITGHLHGIVYFWDSQTFPESQEKFGTLPIASFKVHGDFTEFGLMYIPAWEVDHRLKHNLIIATCSDKQKSWVMKIEGLRVSLIQDFTGRMLGCRVSVYGNTFALVSDRKGLRLFHIEECGDIVVESACDDMWEIDNINMWKNQAYVFSIEPGHVYRFLADQGIFSVCGFTINPSYSKPCHCYFWRGHVVAQILCSKELVISLSSINSHKVYEVFPQLHTSPTCLHFRGNIFLMGTDSGAVYIYTVSKEEELLKLDLCNFVKRWYVSSKGLEHLGTCRTSQGLCIIASTPHRLYTLTYPCEEL